MEQNGTKWNEMERRLPQKTLYLCREEKKQAHMLQKSKTFANLAVSFSNERRHTRKAFALIRRKICKFTVERAKEASSCVEYITPSPVDGQHIPAGVSLFSFFFPRVLQNLPAKNGKKAPLFIYPSRS